MKNAFKKIFFLSYIVIAFGGFFMPFNNIFAADPPCPAPGKVIEKEVNKVITKVCVNEGYTLLAPIKGPDGDLTNFNPGDTNALGHYLNILIKILIGLAAVTAVVMIVIGGMQYMTSELVSGKEEGRETITNAIFGLILALGAYAILFTINPSILITDINIKKAEVTINLTDLGGESSERFQFITPALLQAKGITCPNSGGKGAITSIGQQFVGKVTYSMQNRNKSTSSTLYADCSSFVAQVYRCAGLNSPGNTTADMFSNTNRVPAGTTVDLNGLNAGDLVGWQKGDNGSGKKVEENGHVMIYLGGGKVLHSSSTNGGVVISDLSEYKDRITYVKWP